MWGGEGADTFVFQLETHDGALHRNAIRDWEQGDRIRLIDTSVVAAQAQLNGIVPRLEADGDEIWVKHVYSMDELPYC